jgi:hypothetical protein
MEGKTTQSGTRDPETGLPLQEANQPDPMLQITTGHLGAGGITLAALVVAVILGIVFYGLNSRVGDEHTAAAPPTASSTPPAQPQAAGKGGPAAPSAPRANESGVKG